MNMPRQRVIRIDDLDNLKDPGLKRPVPMVATRPKKTVHGGNWIPKRPARAKENGSRSRLSRQEDLQSYLRGRRTSPTLPQTHALLEVENGPRLKECTIDLHIPPDVRERHLLIVGKTGSGKTTRALLPMIWSDLQDRKRTVIVLDAKGDLTGPVLEMTRKARGDHAQVRYISFTEPDRSLRWNPIEGVATPSECRDIVVCLSSALQTEESRDSAFFRNQAERTAIGMIQSLQRDPKRCNLATVKEILDLPLDEMAKYARKHGLKEVAAQISLAQSANHNAETVFMEAQNYVAPFGDEDVAQTTSCSDFRLTDLEEKPLVLILRFPEGVDRLLALHTIFVKRLFRWVVDAAERQRSRRLPIPVSCYLDEFASALARLPDIERTIHTFRSRGFQFTAAIQSMSQLAGVYGEKRAPVLADGFNSLILLSPVGLGDASYASQKSGLMSSIALDTDGSPDGRILRESTVIRNVLSESEVALPPVHPKWGPCATFLLPDVPPFWGALPPIWEQDPFRSWNWSRGGKVPAARPQKRPKRARNRWSSGFGGETSAEVSKGLGHEVSNTRGWSEEKLEERLAEVKKAIGIADVEGTAAKWWRTFETENKHRLALVLRLAEELMIRKTTIKSFFTAYVRSQTDNIQANLHYFDYFRIKDEEDREKRERAKKAILEGLKK